MAGGQPFELFFKSGDMNDVLKSLTMVDLSNKSGEDNLNDYIIFSLLIEICLTKLKNNYQRTRPRWEEA